jgi:hypothetical protein
VGITHQQVCEMRLHSLVHHTKLCGQSFHIILDISLQAFEVDTVLMQRMQDLFFLSVTWRVGFGLGLLPKAVEVLSELPEILTSHVSYRLKRRGLKVFKTGMVEELANRTLESSTANPWSHQRTVFTDDDRSNVGLRERFWVVLLKLVLISLRLNLHLLDNADFGADFPSVLHLPNVALHPVGESTVRCLERLSGEHAHVRFCLRHHMSLRVSSPIPFCLHVRDRGERVIVIG